MLYNAGNNRKTTNIVGYITIFRIIPLYFYRLQGLFCLFYEQHDCKSHLPRTLPVNQSFHSSQLKCVDCDADAPAGIAKLEYGTC